MSEIWIEESSAESTPCLLSLYVCVVHHSYNRRGDISAPSATQIRQSCSLPQCHYSNQCKDSEDAKNGKRGLPESAECLGGSKRLSENFCIGMFEPSPLLWWAGGSGGIAQCPHNSNGDGQNKSSYARSFKYQSARLGAHETVFPREVSLIMQIKLCCCSLSMQPVLV